MPISFVTILLEGEVLSLVQCGLLREMSIFGEPGAVIPQAGICAGGGRVTALCTATVADYYRVVDFERKELG